MRDAHRELSERIRSGITTGSATPTSIADMRGTLAAVEDVLHGVTREIGRAALTLGSDAANGAVGATFDYLQDANQRFLGRALPIRESAMFDRATSGTRASILRRLASLDGEQERSVDDPDADAEIPPSSMLRPGGVLSRYSIATVGAFEDVLRVGMLTGKPWGDVREELVTKSPFLQGAPKSWAERIVRTETMGAYNRAGWESIREADDELGDMVKILSAVFDDRTGWDSYQVHGQIRRPDEAFAWRGGLYQAPPNRPNDREVVVPHRIAWPIPSELGWRSDGEVAAAWKRERRKGGPPGRPQMTTVPLSRFGRDSKKKGEPSKEERGAAPPAPAPELGTDAG